MSPLLPPGGAFEGAWHHFPLRVYFEDTDATGLVFHGAYVNYLERGRTEALRSAGFQHAQMMEAGLAFAITRLEVAYRRSARIDDALVVSTRYQGFKGPRLTVGQRIVRGEDLIAEAIVEVACIDLAGRPRKPSKALLDAVRPLVFDHAP